jgi:hypothetical protein
MAVLDGAAGTNPILYDAATYTKIANNAFHGVL